MIRYKEFYEREAFKNIREEMEGIDYPINLSEYYTIEKSANEKQRWNEIKRNYKLRKLVEKGGKVK